MSNSHFKCPPDVHSWTREETTDRRRLRGADGGSWIGPLNRAGEFVNGVAPQGVRGRPHLVCHHAMASSRCVEASICTEIGERAGLFAQFFTAAGCGVPGSERGLWLPPR